jgi:formylglycine-generating enzyme required for sulfatase activity
MEIVVAGVGTLNIQGEGLNRDVPFSGAGTMPVSGLQVGNYSLRMRYGDGKTEDRTVAVEAGQKARVSFSYRIAPQVSSVQSGARPERPLPDGFVHIPGGTFMMGSPTEEVGRNTSESQHQVTVSSFSMSKYEITQREWAAVMGRNRSKFKGDNLPVENVSWYEAIEYCNKRSVKEGLTPAYTVNGDSVTWNRKANGYRLPTEAEWEYACRAGTTTRFSTGYTITTNQANYKGNTKGAYRKKTWDVGSGAANVWGLYDMHGNVWEWCWDWYRSYGSGIFINGEEWYRNDSGTQTDPVGPASGVHRVPRGGSWIDDARDLRSANRFSIGPSHRYDNVGFRLVRP